MPVVIATLIVGAGSIHPVQLGRVGIKAQSIYMLTTAFAVALGLFFGNLLKPGKGMDFNQGNSELAIETAMETPSMVDILVNIVPNNLFNAFTTGNILLTIFLFIRQTSTCDFKTKLLIQANEQRGS